MLKHLTFFAVLLSVAGLLPVAAPAGGKKDDKKTDPRKAAIVRAQEFLKAKGKTALPPFQMFVENKLVNELFPEHVFIAVRYQRYPVAVAPPPGLESSNLLAVPREGELKAITHPDHLNELFVARLRDLQGNIDEKKASQAAFVYLSLLQELYQDGFYAFQVVQAESKKDDDGNMTTVGRAVVMKGGNGELRLNMTISATGRLTLGHSTALRAGPRPRCQATKLLDEDEIVRHMAESELLFMGMAARPYLLEQRDKAAPQLRRAIDRILRKIEADGW